MGLTRIAPQKMDGLKMELLSSRIIGLRFIATAAI
jgi:hypothetical protein